MTTADPAVMIPDEVGCVYGWRTWRWNAEQSRLEPYFIGADTAWTSTRTTAACLRPERMNAELNAYELLMASFGTALLANTSAQHRIQRLRDMLHVLEVNSHAAPHPSCVCGLYAAKEKYAVPGVSYNGLGHVPIDKDVVLGRVKMWGRVIEYEDGYRAEHAQIVSLVDTRSPAVKTASRQYDVPLESPISGTWSVRRNLIGYLTVILMLLPSIILFIKATTLFSLMGMIACFCLTWAFAVATLPRTRIRYVWQAIRGVRSGVPDGRE